MRGVVQRSFEDLGTPLREVSFCVLDLETTGGSPESCRITEVGALRFLGGECTGTFQTLVDPGCDIPPFITVLTGIDGRMVSSAPPIEAVLPGLIEFVGESVIVGHNVRFDLGFLAAAARRLGYSPFSNRWVDTAALARRLVREEVRNLRLATLAAHLRSPQPPTHRALDDARATAWVFHALLERAGTMGVTALDDLLELPTARGSRNYGKLRLADGLPRRPGVYLFRDRRGEVLYVGKAKNLRTRVRAYFYGDPRRRIASLLNELAEVDHRVCRTELEAAVVEARLLHAHRPRYNRHGKPARAPHWLRLADEEFPRPAVVRRPRPDGTLHLGPFRGRRGARAVLEAIWDAVPVRRCSGRPGGREGTCAFAQLGVALCPCDGTLDPSAYRRVVDALRRGWETEPGLLLDRLEEKMHRLAEAERFEEAAAIRDRHRALARALEARRAWLALRRAGTLWLEDHGDGGAIVEQGRLAAAWGPDDRPPLLPAALPAAEPAPDVPSAVAEADEARLVWRWLHRPGVRLLDVSGTLSLPVAPVPTL